MSENSEKEEISKQEVKKIFYTTISFKHIIIGISENLMF